MGSSLPEPGALRRAQRHATEVVTVMMVQGEHAPGHPDREMYGTRARFGSVNADLHASAVAVQPPMGKGVIQYPNSLIGAVAVMKRGEISFTDKARKAAAAGAIALIVVNTEDHAFVPDTTPGEGAEDIAIPVVCVRRSDGAALIARLPCDVTVHFDGSEADEYASNIPLVSILSTTQPDSTPPRSDDTSARQPRTPPTQEPGSAPPGSGGTSARQSPAKEPGSAPPPGLSTAASQPRVLDRRAMLDRHRQHSAPQSRPAAPAAAVQQVGVAAAAATYASRPYDARGMIRGIVMQPPHPFTAACPWSQ